MSDDLVFFHAPQTRSYGVAVLLEELHAPHERRVLNFKAGEHRQADYLAINPMGKVPAVLHQGALVTEQAAVYLYLADLFPQAGLTPAIGDPLRGPLLRWLAFYGSSFEPAVVDRHLKREPGSVAMSPYGTFEGMFGTLQAQLGRGPYILGERFTAADVLWGSALRWMLRFGLVPQTAEVPAYVERVTSRPSFAAMDAEDARLAAAQAAAAA